MHAKSSDSPVCHGAFRRGASPAQLEESRPGQEDTDVPLYPRGQVLSNQPKKKKVGWMNGWWKIKSWVSGISASNWESVWCSPQKPDQSAHCLSCAPQFILPFASVQHLHTNSPLQSMREARFMETRWRNVTFFILWGGGHKLPSSGYWGGDHLMSNNDYLW